MLRLTILVSCLYSSIMAVEIDRRSLLPKSLISKMCARDGSHPICSFPDAIPLRNPVSIWRICDHNPHIPLCNLKAPADFPLTPLTNSVKEITSRTEEGDEVIEISDDQSVLDSSDVDSRHALMEKFVSIPPSRKIEKSVPDTNPDPFEESVILAEEDVFGDMRQLKKIF